MANIQDIQDRLSLYKQAEIRILQGQSYQIGTISYTRANIRDVQAEIRKLEGDLAQAQAVASSSPGGLMLHSQAVFRGRR